MRKYLSIQHRDNPDDGSHRPPCSTKSGAAPTPPNAPTPTACWAVIDNITARLAPDDPQSARVKTLSIFAMMVGTLQLSRSLADRKLANAVLQQKPQNVLALLGAERQS